MFTRSQRITITTIQTVSFINSLRWPVYVMNSLIKLSKLFVQYVLRFRILKHQNPADLISLTWYDSQSKKGSLYSYLKNFPFTSSLQNNMQCRGYSSTSPWVHSSLFSFLYRFVRTWSSVACSLNFHFFSVARGELSLLWNCDLSLLFPSFHHMISLDSSCFEFRFAG